MLNNFTIVGRVQDLKQEQEKNIIMLEVTRSYKNTNGEYEKDLLTIETTKTIYDKTIEYIKIGDLIGVKGSIQNNNTLIAEKVTFLSTRKEDEE
ncbi:MAG: hypothetical protein V8Q75_03390 [Bacilli bacterium]